MNTFVIPLQDMSLDYFVGRDDDRQIDKNSLNYEFIATGKPRPRIKIFDIYTIM